MRKRWPIGVLVMGVIALKIGIYMVLDVPDPVRAVHSPDARVPVSAAVELSVGEVRGRLQRRFEEDSVFGASPQPWPNLEGFGPAYGPQLHSFSVEDNADGGPEGRFERAADGLNPRVIDPGLPAYLAHPPPPSGSMTCISRAAPASGRRATSARAALSPTAAALS